MGTEGGATGEFRDQIPVMPYMAVQGEAGYDPRFSLHLQLEDQAKTGPRPGPTIS